MQLEFISNKSLWFVNDSIILIQFLSFHLYSSASGLRSDIQYKIEIVCLRVDDSTILKSAIVCYSALQKSRLAGSMLRMCVKQKLIWLLVTYFILINVIILFNRILR